jgi:acyl carrier protein
MNQDKFLKLLRQAIDLKPEAPLSMATELKSISNWDSLSMIAVISMLDFECRVVASADSLRSCKTVAEIFALAEKPS